MGIHWQFVYSSGISGWLEFSKALRDFCFISAGFLPEVLLHLRVDEAGDVALVAAEYPRRGFNVPSATLQVSYAPVERFTPPSDSPDATVANQPRRAPTIFIPPAQVHALPPTTVRLLRPLLLSRVSASLQVNAT